MHKFFIYTVFVVVYTWNNIQFDQMWANGSLSQRLLAGISWLIPTVMSLYYLHAEARQALLQGSRYFVSIWNWWDLAGYFIVTYGQLTLAIVAANSEPATGGTMKSASAYTHWCLGSLDVLR